MPLSLTQSVSEMLKYENNALELIEHNCKHRGKDLELFFTNWKFVNGLNWRQGYRKVQCVGVPSWSRYP